MPDSIPDTLRKLMARDATATFMAPEERAAIRFSILTLEAADGLSVLVDALEASNTTLRRENEGLRLKLEEYQPVRPKAT